MKFLRKILGMSCENCQHYKCKVGKVTVNPDKTVIKEPDEHWCCAGGFELKDLHACDAWELPYYQGHY